MKAKQKAKELYSKYYNRIEHTLSEEYSPNERDVVKQCALVAIDEMIYTCWKFYTALQFPAKVTGDEGYIYFKREIQYLEEVKEEIELL